MSKDMPDSLRASLGLQRTSSGFQAREELHCQDFKVDCHWIVSCNCPIGNCNLGVESQIYFKGSKTNLFGTLFGSTILDCDLLVHSEVDYLRHSTFLSQVLVLQLQIYETDNRLQLAKTQLADDSIDERQNFCILYTNQYTTPLDVLQGLASLVFGHCAIRGCACCKG